MKLQHPLRNVNFGVMDSIMPFPLPKDHVAKASEVGLIEIGNTQH